LRKYPAVIVCFLRDGDRVFLTPVETLGRHGHHH
jgi:hypothetical protein